MAKKPETRFRARIYPDLKNLRNTVVIPIQQKAFRGHPDFVLCVNSIFVALELKDDSGDVSALQEKLLNDVNKAKGLALVATPSNWKEIYKTLVEISCQNIEPLDILKESH